MNPIDSTGPLVSVIIPYRNKSDYLMECLGYLSQMSYPNFEVILLPDAPEKDYFFPKPLKIIPTGSVGPAKKRDMGCKIAKGSIFAFIDDDAYPDAGWLNHAVRHFENDPVAAVTGPAVTPTADKLWQKASGLIYSTPLSAGHCTYRYRIEKPREVIDAASVNLIVRAQDYWAVGGFNTHYYPGEDTKLCLDFTEKLRKKIIYEPNALVWHHRRSLFIPHLKQVSQYALHRGFFIKKFPGNSLKLSYFLPSIFTLYCCVIFLCAFDPFKGYVFLTIPFILYSILLLRSLLENNSLALSLLTWAGSILTHWVYGFNFIRGFWVTELKR